MTHFPILTEFIDGHKIVTLTNPNDVPEGKSFRVLRTNVSKSLESQVKRNATLLDAVDLSGHSGDFVVFNQGTLYFAKTFADGVNLGKEKFGEDVGFVVREVGKEIVLSFLVKS